MTRRVIRWSGLALAGLVTLAALTIVAAAATDRPSTRPLTVDRAAPEVQAFLAAERALMRHHGLEYDEHVVAVDDPGVRVRVLEVGDGPPVLAVPPAPGEAARLAPLLAELDGYRFLLVNLPGGGASDGVDWRAVDHRDLARATLDAVYEHFELDAAPLIASSMGGTWALWYGLDRPGRVTAGVQLGVPLAVEGATVPRVLSVLGVPGLNRIVVSALLPAAAPADAADGFAAAFGHPDESIAALPRPALEFEYALEQLPTFGLTWRSLAQDTFRLAGLGGWNPAVAVSRDELAAVEHPTLLIWPSDDPFGDVDVGRTTAAHLPAGELRQAGVGHLPWLDDPAAVAELTAEFLATRHRQARVPAAGG